MIFEKPTFDPPCDFIQRAAQRHSDYMNTAGKSEIISHDLRILKPVHRLIRKIKREHSPKMHGFRIWKSSWMLVDFLAHQHLRHGLNILDIGCGWGLASIYCAKTIGANVTCLDIDAEVFPFLELQAKTNNVRLKKINIGMENLSASHLQGFDLIIGADICFWDELIGPWQRLIRCVSESEHTAVILADPGRTSFRELERRCLADYEREAIHWEISDPFAYSGRILKIG